jgi:hypothetical protein
MALFPLWTRISSCLPLHVRLPLDGKAKIRKAILSTLQTNRDAHVLFRQIGAKRGDLPEAIVRGAFLTVWAQENQAAVEKILEPILDKLRQQN